MVTKEMVGCMQIIKMENLQENPKHAFLISHWHCQFMLFYFLVVEVNVKVERFTIIIFRYIE